MKLLKTLGKQPESSLLRRSDRFRNGRFENLSSTIQLAKGVTVPRIMWRYLNKPADTGPGRPIPSVTTDLRANPAQPSIVWFGHSSYLLQVGGLNILVDPVFSGHASPFSFAGRSFPGSDAYSVNDMPAIDLLIITHDHYDHLDFATVTGLRPKVRQVATSLGVGAHLRYWGYAPECITEFDWWESRQLGELELTATPARHFSGRTFRRNATLWSSFVLRVNGIQVFIGADSGYDDHFREIGGRFGRFDIALLECGQYNEWWPQIHMMPEETARAAVDLRTDYLMPVHWAKFALAMHPWYEPVDRVLSAALPLNLRVTTPMIGERVLLGSRYPDTAWWRFQNT